MKKVIALIAILCMLFSIFTVTSLALTTDDKVEIYKNRDLNGELTRTVKADGTVISDWKGEDGERARSILYPDGRIYADGKLVGTLQIETNKLSSEVGFELHAASGDVSWGKWQNFSETIQTGGKSAAIITSMIGLVCPEGLTSLTADLIAQIQMAYDYLEFRGRVRYGSDTTYYYYERYSNFYGNGLTTEKLFPKDLYGTGKERL